MTCPHGICYGLKWLLRHEGPRDHVDMIMNLASVPNVVVLDMANMMVAHARNRGYDVFQPFQGRVAECTPENIEKARDGEMEVDWPWFPNGAAERDMAGMHDQISDGEQFLVNPTPLIVYRGCPVSINLLERAIWKLPNSLTTEGTVTITLRHP